MEIFTVLSINILKKFVIILLILYYNMPEALRRLIDLIGYLPGIGEKTATKLAIFLLRANPAYVKKFGTALSGLHESLHTCDRCHGITDRTDRLCPTCRDPTRDSHLLCVVEDYIDMLAIERLGIYSGLYHVLGGSLSPVHGILPEDLTLTPLFARIAEGNITELILATNANIEGEATSMYIREHNPKPTIRITRLSKGLPNAGAIEYADEVTLVNAFKGRG